MEWVINIVGGLIVAALLGTGGWLWRHFWNPVVWRLSKADEFTWHLTRVSGGIARVVTIDDATGESSPEVVHGMTTPVHRDMAPGSHRDIKGLIPRADMYITLYWISGKRWHGVNFFVMPLDTDVLVRRKAIRRDSLDKTLRSF